METNHDIFISHSSTDSKLAYAICHYLEERGIRCWIAPRDVQGGMEYAESIILGIRSCKVMVVVFSENANNSLFVKNEVERAFNYKSIIIPFKVEDIIPSATLELFLGSVHWLDAVKGNAEDYFDLLYQNCARSLGIKLNIKEINSPNPSYQDSEFANSAGVQKEDVNTVNTIFNKASVNKLKKEFTLNIIFKGRSNTFWWGIFGMAINFITVKVLLEDQVIGEGTIGKGFSIRQNSNALHPKISLKWLWYTCELDIPEFQFNHEYEMLVEWNYLIGKFKKTTKTTIKNE